MQITTATQTNNEPGPLTRIVNQFVQAQADVMAKGPKVPEDWDPVSQFVAVDEFKRVGAYLEELDWRAYTQFLNDWAQGTRFEMTEFFITEAGNAVFQEIEERHYHGDTFIRKNVIAVYRFTEDGKIKHLDIYEQAQDSGEWIKDAARESTLA